MINNNAECRNRKRSFYFLYHRKSMVIAMKKSLIIILLAFLLTALLSPIAIAADLDLVTDITGTLTDAQKERLNQRAERISEQYRCEVAIVVIDAMDDRAGAYAWAQSIYQEYNFGYGPERSGILLFLSLAERDYYMIAFGFGNTAFTDYGKNVMLDNYILPLLGNNRYYDAFSAYLDKAEEFLAMARDGTPFDRHTDPAAQRTTNLIKIAVVILVPLIIAFLICSIWKSQMKTARIAATACDYIPPGGFQLTGYADTFLYRTVTRTKIQKSSSSGGTTINRSGFSGRGGKF